MKHEFKVKREKGQTVYTLESASVGGTSTAGGATVSGVLGGVRRRNGNLLAQETDNKKEAPKPRNFVAKNAKMGGAGAHKDKKKEQKQGKEKHRKPYMEDHEIQMASSELQAIAKNAVHLLDLIKKYSEAEGLEAWQQSKITKAADYLTSVLQSISGKESGLSENDLAQQMMALAKSKGMNARLAGTPEQERERTQQMMAQRAKDRAEQERQAAQTDAAKLPELKAEYKKMLDQYKSLGGSNWQYADREQNLSDAERKARSMEPELRRLGQRIAQAEKHSVDENQGISKDQETKFHAKLDKLVHKTFGKRDDEVEETAPKGWEGTVKAMKKHKDIDNPWALAHWMKNKGYKSHKKEDAYLESLLNKLEERSKK